MPELVTKQPVEDMPELPVMAKWTFGNIRVVYELISYSDQQVSLPPYLAVRPMVGDIIESVEKRRFEVKEISHIMDNKKAALKLVIGKPTGGDTAISAGGSQDIIGTTL